MSEESKINFEELSRNAISKPLVKNLYTADPSAHVFNDRIYINRYIFDFLRND